MKRRTVVKIRMVMASAASLALAGTMIAIPAQANEPFNATIKGFPSNTPLVALPPSMTLPIDAVNIPAGVGLYALHCEVPSNPRSAPTNCDSAADALQYLVAGAARPAVSIPLKVNAEFYGTNPNPVAGVANTPSLVDCRLPMDNPRATKCGIYVLGAGRDAANPAYLRFWPTSFSPLTNDRRAQLATVRVDGKVMGPRMTGSLVKDVPKPFTVRLNSGLTPNLSSDNCSIAGGTITALANSGTCTVTITSSGGKNVRPFISTRTFALS
jgi:hypothetical protein